MYQTSVSSQVFSPSKASLTASMDRKCLLSEKYPENTESATHIQVAASLSRARWASRAEARAPRNSLYASSASSGSDTSVSSMILSTAFSKSPSETAEAALAASF